jgi:phenylacetate-CoA ligase
MQFNPKIAFEPLAVQHAWQADALKKLLEYVQHNSPFYKKLFARHHIDVHNIKSLADLQFLPTTSKSDMQEHNWEFLCVPDAKIKEYTATSGTMGKPVTIALSENDLQRLAHNEHQSFVCADGKPGDIYQLMLTLDRQFMAGMAYYMGIRQLGAALVRTGPGLPSMQWDTLNRLQANSIVAVPSFILKLIESAVESKTDLKHSPVQKAICIGESLRDADFELNALGQQIHNDWPIKLYATYASTEMQTAFTECAAGMGGHQQPDLIILEIRAYYDSHCSCGRHSPRLSPVLGRTQQMIKYKGTTLYPPAIFDILNNVPFITEYVVEVFTNELKLDELRLHLNSSLPADECERKLQPIMQSRLRVMPLVQFHSAATIQQMQFPAGSRKQVKFVDKRDTPETPGP